jgi:hypothetical protein
VVTIASPTPPALAVAPAPSPRTALPSPATPVADSDLQTPPEDQSCIVCMDAMRNSVFVPCGHIACCFTCANALPKPTQCPICCTKTAQIVQTFVA